MAVFAAQCSQGSMHISPDVGIVEVLDDDDKPVPYGVSGRLVCTGLVNRAQPFIRYRVGDIGSLSEEKCSCGSPLPLLGSIEGRSDDVLITRDGRRIGRLDPVFKGTKGIAQAQIIQHDYDKFTIKVVPGKDYKPRDGQDIESRLIERIGKGEVIIEMVEKIKRTETGKFKAVICNLQKK
jgi:phenylacetate-CoA ligase